MLYLDSSAIVKLVRPEPESHALFAFLGSLQERISSVIATVEVLRAVRRSTRASLALTRAEEVFARIGLVELDLPIRRRAAALEPSGLRTLDAIHIATALDLVEDLSGFVTYDVRQAAVAIEHGLEVFSPR